MKKTKWNFLILLLALILSSKSSFAYPLNNPNYQTECVTTENTGYISLKIWNTSKGKRYKYKEARMDAIKAILYSGVEAGNGCSTQPAILNKSQEEDKFKNIEKSFFSKKGKWSTFIRSSSITTTLPERIENKKWKVYEISISKDQLRKYLEEQKIINSLNNGF